jgi:hypothetical protein
MTHQSHQRDRTRSRAMPTQDRGLRKRKTPKAARWRTVAMLAGAFLLSWVAGFALSGVVDVREQPHDATLPGVGPQKSSGSSPTDGGAVAVHLASAGTALTAGRLRAAQSGYLTILLSLAPDNGQAQEGLVTVQRRWANNDPTVLRRQARTYRLAAARGTEPDNHYSSAALALLVDANLRAANEIEIDRAVTARSGASAVPGAVDAPVLSSSSRGIPTRPRTPSAKARLSPVVPRATRRAPPRALSQAVHCSDSQGPPCGARWSAPGPRALHAATIGEQEVAAHNRHGINLTDMHDNAIAIRRDQLGPGESLDSSPVAEPGSAELPAMPKDTGAPPAGTNPARGIDKEASGAGHQGSATGSASVSSSGGSPGGTGSAGSSAGPSGGSSGTGGSGSHGGTGSSGSSGGPSGGSSGGSGGRGGSGGSSGGNHGNGGGGSGGGHDGHDGRSGDHDRDGDHHH